MKPERPDRVVMVGGAKDGQTWEVNPNYRGDVLIVPVSPTRLTRSFMEDPLAPLPEERYRLHRIRGEWCSFTVWVHESLGLDQAVSRLLDAYGKQNPEAGD